MGHGYEKSEASTVINNSDIYRRMVEEIQDYAIILIDRNGVILNWNKGAQKIKLYSEAEILGKHFSIFYLPDDLDQQLPQKLLKEASETGRAAQEGWRKRKNGTKFWGSITITAIHDDNGNVIGFCKVTRDLTEKKISEDSLRLSEERYHQMIAEVQDYAIILLSIEGTIENWNVGAEKIKGYSATEAVGKKFEIFYTEEDRKNGLPNRLLTIAKESGKALQEGWRVRKDGTKFWGTIVITAIHNKEGKIIGFTKVTRDLTAQKIAEDKLAAYTAELEKQNGELEQFAYIASHDLQEPLRKIQTFTELIRDNFDDTPFVERYFEKLNTSAVRMSELIKSLLNYGRLSKEKGKSTFSEVNLNDVLNEVKTDYELLIEEKKALILNNNLPVIQCNRFQIAQLFSNLINNSLKFSLEKPVIRITATIISKDKVPDVSKKPGSDTYFQITFADNGIGFDAKYSELIFSLFQRLHGKQSQYKGTGIGLALCKKITEIHNGFILADSSPGKGATFTIYLPCN